MTRLDGWLTESLLAAVIGVRRGASAYGLAGAMMPGTRADSRRRTVLVRERTRGISRSITRPRPASSRRPYLGSDTLAP